MGKISHWSSVVCAVYHKGWRSLCFVTGTRLGFSLMVSKRDSPPPSPLEPYIIRILAHPIFYYYLFFKERGSALQRSTWSSRTITCINILSRCLLIFFIRCTSPEHTDAPPPPPLSFFFKARSIDNSSIGAWPADFLFIQNSNEHKRKETFFLKSHTFATSMRNATEF